MQNASVYPTRKPTRLQNYDYSQNGCYFVTVCVKNRKRILSTIVGGDDLGAPKIIRLKPCGKIAEKYIQSMETAYDTVKVDNYILMPNHLHLLISINTYGAPRLRLRHYPFASLRSAFPLTGE